MDCHAIEGSSLDRGWDLRVTVWSRDALDAWTSGEAIQERGVLGDAYDAATFAESLAGEDGAAVMIPYNVFEEVVDEHDTNYLIALAISVDQLPGRVTDDEVSRRIRTWTSVEGSRFASRTLHLSRSMSWPRYTGAIRWKPMKWKSL